MSEKQGHSPKKTKGFPWFVCSRCDLVYLKNKATEKAARGECVGQYVNVNVPKSLRPKEVR